jgi:hypothetical protein
MFRPIALALMVLTLPFWWTFPSADISTHDLREQDFSWSEVGELR